MLTENKFSKYFVYAIGEIILVVIGILIALQINNWNEQNKSKKEEMKILNEIKISLARDLKYMSINLRSDSSSIRHLKIIKEQLQLEKPTIDSLNYFYQSLLFTNSVDITTGPYETLKSKGLDLISNDSLRNGIVYYYEQTSKYYIDKNFFLDKNFTVEYCTKLFNTVAFVSEQIIPNDYESLRKDMVFLNLLNTKMEEIRFKNRVLIDAKKEVQNLIDIIDVELKHHEN